MNEAKFDTEPDRFDGTAHSQQEVEDPMATARFPSMPSAPPLPLRAPARAPASKPMLVPAPNLARPAWFDEKPRWWWMFLPFKFQTATRYATAADDARHEVWLRRRAGVASGALGLFIIVGALSLGFSRLASEKFPDQPDMIGLSIAVVIAHAAITILGVAAGYAILRLGERLVAPLTSPPIASSEAPFQKRVLGVSATKANAAKEPSRGTA